jgi:chitodextrinase
VYKAFDTAAGSDVDWYNVQFYNQGADEYTTCDGLFEKSSAAWPGTSVFELHTVQGIPLDKIVVGKPGIASQAANGFIGTAELAVCAAAAALKGWNAGIMTWEYTPQHVDSTWATSVRAATWPLSGGGSQQNPGGAPPPPASASKPAPTSSKAAPTSSKATTSTAKTSTSSVKTTATSSTKTASTSSIKTTTSSSVPTSSTSAKTTVTSANTTSTASKTSSSATPSSSAPSSCGSASAWAPATTYWAGDAVAYNGAHYTAKWWSVGDVPTASGQWGVWKACAGTTADAKTAAHRKMVRTHKKRHH